MAYACAGPAKQCETAAYIALQEGKAGAVNDFQTTAKLQALQTDAGCLIECHGASDGGTRRSQNHKVRIR